MGMIENMRDAVEMAGGRMGEDAYLAEVKRLIEADGGDTTLASLRANAFAKRRMIPAGVMRVTIGATKEVWLQEKAEEILNGTLSGMAPAATVEHEYLTGEGAYNGIPIRSFDEFPQHLHTNIYKPGSVMFEETNKGEMRLMSIAYRTGHNMMFTGPKGCGKTMAVKAFASHIGLPVLRVNCSEGITEDQFIGYNTLIDGEVVWVDGLLPIAMRSGCLLLLDEFNGARAEILIALNSVGDSGSLLLPLNGNEVVKAHDSFRMVATMNPTEGYEGVQQINQATKDRFALQINFGYLEADKEIAVIQKVAGVTNPPLARELVALANDLRRLRKDHTLESDTSTRTLIQMLEMSNDLNTTELVDYIMVGKYQAHEAEDVKMAARSRLSAYGDIPTA
jgi:MoxR-like ATPase